MSENLDDIQKILHHYFDMQEPLYAVLICGEWGSGKTYWWKNDFAPTLSKNRDGILYISLNGIASPKDASKKLLCEIIKSKVGISPCNDMVNNTLVELGKAVSNMMEPVKNVMTPFLGAIESVAKMDINASNILDLYGSLEKYIICIDDLERYNCGEDVTSILGWLSDLLEVKKAHIVILANEEKIKDYSSIKEKVVGRTIGLKLDCRQVISSIIQKAYNGDCDETFLKEHINIIVEIFEYSNKRNYRVLRNTLADFCFLYKKLRKDNEDALKIAGKDILRACLAFGMELRANALDGMEKEGFRNAVHSGLDFGLVRACASNTVSTEGKTRFEKFCKQYGHQTTYFWSRFSCIFDYMDIGYLDSKLFCDMLSRYREKEPSLLEYVLYYSPFEMEDEKFHTVSDGLLKMIENGEVALRYYQVLFARYGLYVCQGIIEKSLDELEKSFVEGLRKIIKIPDADSDASNPQNDFVKTYLPTECEDAYERIKEKVRQASVSLRKRKEKETKRQFMELLNENPEMAIRMLQVGEIPAGYFEVSDAEPLFKTLKTLPNKQKLAFFTAMKYYYVNAATIEADRQFLDSFLKSFKCYLKDNNAQKAPSIALMKQINIFIESCLSPSGTNNETVCH